MDNGYSLMLLSFFGVACIYLFVSNIRNKNTAEAKRVLEEESDHGNVANTYSFRNLILLFAQLIVLFQCYSLVFTFFKDFPKGGYPIEVVSESIVLIALSIVFSRVRSLAPKAKEPVETTADSTGEVETST